MTNTDKATPRPWKQGGNWFDIWGNTNTKENWERVAEVHHSVTGSNKIEQANASLIVKAVNNHEALLNACRKAEIVLSLDRKHVDGVTGEAISPVMKQLRQAIQQAEWI